VSPNGSILGQEARSERSSVADDQAIERIARPGEAPGRSDHDTEIPLVLSQAQRAWV
jgi:hypothetical protein